MHNRLFTLLLAATAFLGSCGGPAGTSNQKAALLDDSVGSTTGLCDSFDIVQFAMDTARAAEIADSFVQFYRHDDAAGRFSSDGSSVSIPRDVMMAFEELAPDLDPATQCLGVRIAYGLDDEANPIFLFGPVVMTRVSGPDGILSFRLAEPASWYRPTPSSWQEITAAEADTAMRRYATRVMKYVDGTLSPLKIDPALGSASDPSSTFFPFTEFRELIRENEAIVRGVFKDQTNVPSITAVRVRWAAEKIGDDGTLKHVVVMVPVLGGPEYPGGDLPLTLKAANMNNLCPPKCEVAEYRAR